MCVSVPPKSARATAARGDEARYMYIYVCVYMYIYVCVCVFVCVYLCMYLTG